MNEAVIIKNCYTMNGGGEWLVRPFKRREFLKFIGCILLEVNYGNKGHKIWSEIPKYSGKIARTKLQRYVRGKTNLYKVCCAPLSSFLHLCLPLNYFILHNLVNLLGVSLGNYLSLSLTGFWHIIDKV